MPLNYPTKISNSKKFVKSVNNTFMRFCQALNSNGIMALFAVASVIFTIFRVDNLHFYGIFALLISWSFIEKIAKLAIYKDKKKW